MDTYLPFRLHRHILWCVEPKPARKTALKKTQARGTRQGALSTELHLKSPSLRSEDSENSMGMSTWRLGSVEEGDDFIRVSSVAHVIRILPGLTARDDIEVVAGLNRLVAGG